MEIQIQRRSRKGLKRDITLVIQLKNRQFLTTLPREVARWKHIDKGSLLKWSDGGLNRIIIEVVKEGE